MPNALQFLIGADSRPFSDEMRKMEAIAASSSRSISARLAGASHGGYAGGIRESFTVAREAIEHRGMGRIIGSATILIGYLSNLFSGANKAGGAAEAAAKAYDLMALRQSLAATP